MVGEQEYKKAIIQNVRGAAFNYWEIGRLLSEAEKEGIILKGFIEVNEVDFGFSYGRGMAFKTWYLESLNNPSVDVKLLGVEKTLALIEPLREHSKDFFVQHSQEKLEKMSVKEVREVAKESGSRLTKKADFEAFFLQAEDSLREAVHLFGGVMLKYKDDFRGWSGRDRVVRLHTQLVGLLADLD